MPDARPSFDEYFLTVAHAVSLRADCTRRAVGAVIVDESNRIVSTGYNGAPAGEPGCLSAGACPRGLHYPVPEFEGDDEPGVCATDRLPWPCGLSVPPGSSYDTGPGACISLHAEANALLYAFRSVKGMTVYITDEPCDGCLKLIRGAQLARVVTPTSEFSF